ncbi:TPA: abortive infection family protein [Vibrio parahaemolyticus]|uniref:abortive infection family protein n=2 Tax=Vibrio parahaemolyticus TaxID=670 RepID=UPI0007A0121D|nr:abortive infection family protein [Vibrio parahaemolyticus]EGR0121143.1 abortive phage resistance protein [Vibrio parahaemolyticus]EGR3299382.1 abortive phage resistance protein [Vibrio parahaemolyticus]EIM1482954.1 abortive infection family protein [Vibrio parahaemolyticus]EJG2240469.1 abortive infection family protein [Vibrio parahaemolyticus]EJG2249485.1 abortive infection family protein [Vibrio parahaemolyticus]
MSELDHLESLFDRVEYLQNLLVAEATGGTGDNSDYQTIRAELLGNPTVAHMIPRFVKTNRNLEQFWQFIKFEYGSYAERRQFLWQEFNPLLEFLEKGQSHPAQQSISEVLQNFDSESIHHAWTKALERKVRDPEGAITIARTILESVCKHILDEKGVEYNSTSIELSELYKLTAKELNMAPEQHNESIFKQILGGCSGIVNGLGTLRNKLGDAHGQGKRPVKPQARHAELAVNLAGTMSLFLISTYEANKK